LKIKLYVRFFFDIILSKEYIIEINKRGTERKKNWRQAINKEEEASNFEGYYLGFRFVFLNITSLNLIYIKIIKNLYNF